MTNGDLFRRANIRPEVGFRSIETDRPKPIPLGTQMAGYTGLLRDMTRRHGRRDTTWEAFASWEFVKAVRDIDYDLVRSTVKVRQAGIRDWIDTHVSVVGHLLELRASLYPVRKAARDPLARLARVDAVRSSPTAPSRLLKRGL